MAGDPVGVVARVREFWPLISEAAGSNSLPPSLLAGLVCQESAGNPYAMRVEPSFKWIGRDLAQGRPTSMSSATEFWGRKTSWGLCQIMGQVARERGFRGWWPALCEPDLNLAYGARHLAWCLARRGGNEMEGLLRWNGGGLKEYPSLVLGWAELFKQRS